MTLDRWLQPTRCLDIHHAAIRAVVDETTAGLTDPVEKAVRLYYRVRDGLRYDPYTIELTPEGLKASVVLANGRGYCVAKAGVLVALARAAGIPARPGFADVRNHLATPRLLEMMGTDVFYFHGYAELYLDGRWVKSTPAFNIELCEKFGVRSLEFDGRTDSLFQPFDTTGRQHMEYLQDRGWRDDIPVEEIREAMVRHYPAMKPLFGGDFYEEAAAEHRRGAPR
jgi:transglutaminase-like putative cysteine protease